MIQLKVEDRCWMHFSILHIFKHVFIFYDFVVLYNNKMEALVPQHMLQAK